MIAEHHIALTQPIDGNKFIGAVELGCSPSNILKETASFVGHICDVKYGVVPTVKIDEGENIKLPYVPVHLEYTFTELLKNSFRALAENIQLNGDLPPVLATFVRTDDGLVIRLRDRGGGIPPEVERKIFGFSFTTFEDKEGDGFTTLNAIPGGGNTIAGMGYGLPLSRAYVEFFGGSLLLQSYYGLGTDVYITIKSPRNLLEGVV